MQSDIIIRKMERLLKSRYELITTNIRDGFYYSSKKLEYTPPGWVRVQGMWYPLGFEEYGREQPWVQPKKFKTIAEQETRTHLKLEFGLRHSKTQSLQTHMVLNPKGL